MIGGMTPNELARYWRCSPDKIRAWINKGVWKFSRLHQIQTNQNAKRSVKGNF